MMRVSAIVIITGALLFGSLDAQVQNVGERRQLQQQVIERLLDNTRVQAGLTDDQFDRYREIARRSIASRTQLQRREQNLWRALEGEMRPGIAANEDSLVALMDSLIVAQEERSLAFRTEQGEYAEFLSPVQRAQLMLTHRRFEANIQQILRRRVSNRPGNAGLRF